MRIPPSGATGQRHRGITLIELTVIILTLLALSTVLFVGMRGWKQGTERARCIMNIRYMQMSVRAFATASEYQPGEDLSTHAPPVSLLGELVGAGKYVPELPRCPGNGLYHFGGDVVPDFGELYMRCSFAGQGHEPKDHENW